MMPSALLLVDVQQGMDDPRAGTRSTPTFEARLTELLAAWRASGLPVVHVKHDSVEPNSRFRPGLPGNALKPEAAPLPGEPLFVKNGSSGFVGTSLEAHLRAQGITSLVVAGFATDHCVSSTVRSASNLGFTVTVVADATATHGRRAGDGTLYDCDTIQRVTLATLHGEFANVVPAREAIAQHVERQVPHASPVA